MPSNVEWPDCGVSVEAVLDLVKSEWPTAPIRKVHTSLAINGRSIERNLWVDRVNTCISTLQRIAELEVESTTDAPLKSLLGGTDGTE